MPGDWRVGKVAQDGRMVNLSPGQGAINRMAADPEPDEVVAVSYCQSAIMQTNSNGPITRQRFQLKRRVCRVALEQFEIAIRQPLDIFGQSPVRLQKSGEAK